MKTPTELLEARIQYCKDRVQQTLELHVVDDPSFGTRLEQETRIKRLTKEAATALESAELALNVWQRRADHRDLDFIASQM